MLDKHYPIAAKIAEPISPFDDPECQYVAMPEGMRTFSAPSLHNWAHVPQARPIFTQLSDSLAANLKGTELPTIDLFGYDLDSRNFIGEVLGEGEISILADRLAERLNITETVFTGIWVAKYFINGSLKKYYIETGAYPKILAEWSSTTDSMPCFPEAFPDGLMNAPALVHEIFVKSNNYTAGTEEIINLSLLPMTSEDTAYLVKILGLAGISVLARGYGDCQISRTLLPNVWWVQYFNSTGQLILNTLEITALPKVVMAAPEDLEDSATRLAEVLTGMN